MKCCTEFFDLKNREWKACRYQARWRIHSRHAGSSLVCGHHVRRFLHDALWTVKPYEKPLIEKSV